jgi:hypothetical protein
MYNNQNFVKRMKDQYPPGTRIRLDYMNDPYAPIAPGTEGKVDFVDDTGTLHCTFDNGRTLGVIPGEDSFSKITPLQTLKLYMPLTVTQYEQDEWGSWDEYPSELNEDTILAYQDQILAAITKETQILKPERGLMEYYHENDSVNKKVQSLLFTVEPVGDRLMGVAECRVQGDLSNAELLRLKEYAAGQASDGFGEGFEQRPIKVSDGEIYVSLWNSDKNWSIMTQEELGNIPQMSGLQFG